MLSCNKRKRIELSNYVQPSGVHGEGQLPLPAKPSDWFSWIISPSQWPRSGKYRDQSKLLEADALEEVNEDEKKKDKMRGREEQHWVQGLSSVHTR